MKTKIEIITPAYAAEVLEKHNPRNRTLSEATVQAYALDMRLGRWMTTHQGIAFDENGNLIDGQHRLWAVVFSGKDIEMMVTRDVPEREIKGGLELHPMDSIDSGRVRTVGQKLQLSHNIKNGNVVAATVRGIHQIISPAWSSKRIAMTTSLYLYEIYQKDVEAILPVVNTKSKQTSFILAPLAMFHRGEPVKAIEFARQIVTLEGLCPTASAFLRYLDGSHITTGTGKLKTMRVMANCLHLFKDGKDIKNAMDGQHGTDYLLGMFPSLIQRIRKDIRPVEIKGKKAIVVQNNSK